MYPVSHGRFILKMIMHIACLAILACNAWTMKQEHDKQNLEGVVYWGFMTLLVAIMLT